MAQSPDWNQLLEAGRQFGAMTRQEAERRVHELVRRGELAQERFQTAVDELLERSREAADDLIVRGRQSAEDVRELVRTELLRQVKSLGLVTRDDLARFAARVGVGRAPAKKASASPAKSTDHQTPARTAPAKKATANTPAGTKVAGAKKAGGVKKTGGVKKAGGVKKSAGAKKTAGVKKVGGAKKATAKKAAKKSSPPGGAS